MSDSILRSFLIKLGFSIRQDEKKKFGDALGDVTREALKTGAAVTGIGLAAQAMVKSYANEMEKLYYVSKRTGSSVQTIQGLESGFQRIGLEAGDATEAIEKLSMSLKLNPGKRGLLDSLTGGKTKGMEDAKAVIELVKSLQNQPFFVGAQFAEKFGMDAKTFQMISMALPQLEEAQNKREQLNKDFGINAQEFAKQSVIYKNTLRDLEDKTKVIGQKIAMNLLGPFQTLAVETNKIIDNVFNLKSADKSGKTWAEKNWAERMAYSWKNRDKNIDAFKRGENDASGNPIGQSVAQQSKQQNSKELFYSLEKKYGLPSGLLDSMWVQESSRGKKMLSSAGAKGHFGFMDKTAKEYGVNDPNDLGQSAEGASRKMKGLLGRYGGDLKKALAAYNFGEGNLERVGGIGNSPLETRNYAKDVPGRMQGGITINNKTDIHISGADSPTQIAREIERHQKDQNAIAIRNIGAPIR